MNGPRRPPGDPPKADQLTCHTQSPSHKLQKTRSWHPTPHQVLHFGSQRARTPLSAFGGPLSGTPSLISLPGLIERAKRMLARPTHGSGTHRILLQLINDLSVAGIRMIGYLWMLKEVRVRMNNFRVRVVYLKTFRFIIAYSK